MTTTSRLLSSSHGVPRDPNGDYATVHVTSSRGRVQYVVFALDDKHRLRRMIRRINRGDNR